MIFSLVSFFGSYVRNSHVGSIFLMIGIHTGYERQDLC